MSTFVCQGCDRTFPDHKRAAMSPFDKPYCKACDEVRREEKAKRQEQGRRR